MLGQLPRRLRESLLPALTCFTFLSVLFASSAIGQVPVARDIPSGPPAGKLMMGPVEGFTTTWHPAPEETAIPYGTVLYLRYYVSEDATVNWVGAEEIRRQKNFSMAEVRCDSMGKHEIRVNAEVSDGSGMSTYSMFEVIDIAPDKVRIADVDVSVKDLGVDETSDNMEIMKRAMSSESIAKLTELGTNSYATSVFRTMTMRVKVTPSSIAPLMEWRTEGSQARIGGSRLFRYNRVGRRTIQVGPPANSETIDLDIYEVKVIGPDDLPPDFYNHPPVTYNLRAETNPPGYEGIVTWLASTTYGSATPLIGEGESFDVTIDDPRSPKDESVWVVCKCDGGKDGTFEEHKQHVHDCSVVTFNVPNNLMGCMVTPAGPGRKNIKGKFFMDTTFAGWCGCCEYRQYRMGSMSVNGMDVTNIPMWEEDCAGGECYGHRTQRWLNWDGYTDGMGNPDQANGCTYHGEDYPGLNNVPCGATYSICAKFRGEVIDNCEGTIEATSNWSIVCSGTAVDGPSEGPVQTEAPEVRQESPLELGGRPATVAVSLYAENTLLVDLALLMNPTEESIDASEVTVAVEGLAAKSEPIPGALLESVFSHRQAHALYTFEYDPSSNVPVFVRVTYGHDARELRFDLN